MGRKPCCDKIGLKQGPWAAEEDKKLINFVLNNEHQCCWREVPKNAGLLRCGKSCRLRWTNYLRPDLKRGVLSAEEEQLIIDLHSQLGNKWSKIASHMPGRTDNEIKNLWHTHIKKKLRMMGIDPITHKPLRSNPLTDQHQNPDDQSPEEEEAEEAEAKEEETRQDKIQEYDVSINSILEESAAMTSSDDHLAQEEIAMDTNNAFSIDEVPLMEPHEILFTDNIDSFLEDFNLLPSLEDWLSDGITLLEESTSTSTSLEDNYNNGFPIDEVPFSDEAPGIFEEDQVHSTSSEPHEDQYYQAEYYQGDNMCNDDFTEWDWLIKDFQAGYN